MDSNDLETSDKPPPQPNNDSRRTHWRGFLKEAFGFSGARYLDMHLDPLGAPSPAKHLIRPFFAAMLGVGALNAVADKRPLEIALPFHLAAASIAYVGGRKLVQSVRDANPVTPGKNRFEMWFGEHKVFDTNPDRNTPPTSLKDLSTALQRSRNANISCAADIGYIFFWTTPQILSVAGQLPQGSISFSSSLISAAAVGYSVREIMRMSAMKNVADGTWVISNEPPPKRQEEVAFDATPAFTFGPAVQTVPVRR
jgi:hypothetical protein